MPRILNNILPQPTAEYDVAQFNQLVKHLQLALALNVESKDDADEREAIAYFLNN